MGLLTKDEQFIKDFAIKFQAKRKEKNYVTFIINNDLSDSEIDFLRMKVVDLGYKPHIVMFPNGDSKVIDWSGMV